MQQVYPLAIELRPQKTTPVTLPPGRARLAAYPASTGLGPPKITIGTVLVIRLAARTASPPIAMIASGRFSSMALTISGRV